jgi:hypothetical protein
MIIDYKTDVVNLQQAQETSVSFPPDFAVVVEQGISLPMFLSQILEWMCWPLALFTILIAPRLTLSLERYFSFSLVFQEPIRLIPFILIVMVLAQQLKAIVRSFGFFQEEEKVVQLFRLFQLSTATFSPFSSRHL